MANIPWKPQAEIDAEKNAPKPPTEADYLLNLDFRLSLIELGLQGE
jgi:hypothetical protein